MTYYILFPGDKESDTIYEDRKLGEANGFGVFWASEGFAILRRLVDQKSETLEHVRIFNEQGKQLQLESFLTKIQKLQIREQ